MRGDHQGNLQGLSFLPEAGGKGIKAYCSVDVTEPENPLFPGKCFLYFVKTYAIMLN